MEEDVIEIYNNDTSPEVDFEINDVIYTDIPSGEIEEMKRDIAQNTADILLRSLITETGNKIDLEINSSTYVLVAKLYDKNNNLISTSSEINLPIESMVIGATYDTQTKEIVLTLQSGETIRVNISDLISGLVNQDDFDALEDRVDIVEDRMDVVEEIMPTISATGTEITLQNTKKAGMKVALSGNTEQDSTTGKNLLNIPNGTYSDNGITAVVSNGKITLNGTASVTSFIRISMGNSITVTANTNYTMSANNSTTAGSSNPYGAIRLNTGSSDDSATDVYFNVLNNSLTFNKISNTSYSTFVIRTGSGLSYTDFVLYPQLELGSTATEFEKFTNGASPNPDYPQEIHIVTGNNTVTVCGKNLFDYNGEIIENFITGSGISYTINNGIYTLNGTNTRTYIYLRYNVTLDSGTYFYSGCPSGGSTKGYSALVNAGGQNYFDFGSGVSFTITQKETIKVYPARIGSSTITANNLQFKPMLIKGSTATSYEPYQGTSYPINLGSIELCKIGDYQDRIFKAVDGDIYYDSLTASQKAGLTYGKWYKHSEIWKKILNGSETWAYQNNNLFNVDNIIPNHLKTLDVYAIKSSHYYGGLTKSTNQLFLDSVSNYNYACGLHPNGTTIRFKDTRYSNVNDFKNALSANNVTIYHVLEVPTDTEITDTTLISQLEALYLAKSAEGTTTISQTNADEPFIITATAFENIDMEGYVRDTDYATSSTGGVIKIGVYYSTSKDANGFLVPTVNTYSEYVNKVNGSFISKGTLENVITGKGLVSNTDIATENNAGVIKAGGAFKIANSGVPYAETLTYAQYLTKSNGNIIGKGTLENVLSARFVTLTQSEYDQLTPDANTFYFITD